MLLDFPLSLHGEKLVVHRVNTGVPHAVVEVEDLPGFPVAEVGRAVRRHEAFIPEGTNVDFVHLEPDGSVAMRTYERGVEDETLACGTGAVASATVLAALRRVRPPVTVRAPGGVLTVGFYMSDSGFCDVTLTGDAKTVYRGTIEQSED